MCKWIYLSVYHYTLSLVANNVLTYLITVKLRYPINLDLSNDDDIHFITAHSPALVQ